MSTFKTKDEYENFKNSVRRFVLTECEALAEEIENTRHLPLDRLMSMLSKMGLLRLTIPEKYGGMGMSFTEFWPIEATVGMTHHSIRLIVHAAGGMWRVLDFGTEEQRREILPGITKGEKFTGFALTEPEKGTGRDMGTTAVAKGDNYILNGEKHLISYADFADVFFTFAVTDEKLGSKGVTAFIVPRDAPGLSIVPMPEMMGVTGSVHGTLIFKDCIVPAKAILGKRGQGLQVALSTLEISRASIASCCLGICQRCLDLSIDFAKKRKTFGKYISERESIREMLADMAIDVRALSLLINDAAQKYDQRIPIPFETSAAKAFAIDAVRRVTDKALLIHGGIGYTRAYPIERLYRDARALWFEEGTPTIQRLVIARTLLR